MDLSTVDPTMGASLIELAGSLSTLALKGTASVIHGKIESLKQEKNTDTIRNTYNDLINQLLEERDEAVRIAQTYKQELEKVVISDEDIEYLQQTVSKVLDIINAMQLVNDLSSDPEKRARIQASIKAVDSLKNLISKDVLKTMQLLGFNYKAAIGEPLTQLCANAIMSFGNKKNLTQSGRTQSRK